jgi:hypothetical protein
VRPEPQERRGHRQRAQRVRRELRAPLGPQERRRQAQQVHREPREHQRRPGQKEHRQQVRPEQQAQREHSVRPELRVQPVPREQPERSGPRGRPVPREQPERPECSELPEQQARSRARRALRAQLAGPAPQRVQPAGPVQQAGTVPQGHRAQPLRAA